MNQILNRIVNELGQSSIDSDSIRFNSFIKQIFGLIRLIRLIEIIN